MKVLYITGSCLTKNTSANMSHNGYVQGLLENGAEVTILMANDSWGKTDNKLHKWENAKYIEFNSVSFIDKIKSKYIKMTQNNVSDSQAASSPQLSKTKRSLKNHIHNFLKKAFYTLYKPDPIYPLEKTWLKHASKYQSKTRYDLVISNSSPAASHKLAALLIEQKKINYKRWIQIWEDPWFHDLYGNYPLYIQNEEHQLLKKAEEIYYVSPLTLHYQKIYFADCAYKMKFIPLPYFKYEKGICINQQSISFGYFGDYYSQTRNLRPFYEALNESGYKGYIYGDNNLQLSSTKHITVSNRVTLEKLEQIQSKTSVLVHLCNLKGGQIPGKIYHYSATEKPILFILDGTEEEQKIIQSFFSQYHRYYFCKNNKESILKAIIDIHQHYNQYKGVVINAFSPKNIIQNILQ